MTDYDPQQCEILITALSPVSAVVISGKWKEQSVVARCIRNPNKMYLQIQSASLKSVMYQLWIISLFLGMGPVWSPFLTSLCTARRNKRMHKGLPCVVACS